MTIPVSYVKLTNEELNATNYRVELRQIMNLKEAIEEKEYIVKEINTDDEELNAFLFSLGCYSGEPITVIKKRRSVSVIAVKDGRYCIDRNLAEDIEIA